MNNNYNIFKHNNMSKNDNHKKSWHQPKEFIHARKAFAGTGAIEDPATNLPPSFSFPAI